jgi:ubiquinone/menaquinone biosynthesis C-methylase UbiE
VRRIVATELMDDPDVDATELAENFKDIELANARFGGAKSVVDAVLARDARHVLDVACGSADIPRALLARARRQGRGLEVVALDNSEKVLAIARARTGAEPAIRFVRADAAELPFADDAFDVATCNLALHHFDPPLAVAVLRELRRVSRLTPIVCDLERSRLGYVATVAFARLIAKNRLTKHDGPLSVKRAYTASELCALAKAGGWRKPRATRAPFFRLLLCDDGA